MSARGPSGARARVTSTLIGSLALALAGCGAPAGRGVRDAELPGLEPLRLVSLFDFSDPEAFELLEFADEPTLVAKGGSRYAPPHRSPLSIALLDGLEFRDFTLEAELLQTGREYGHRDLCLFFGFESPDRFYYVHLATTPDANAHNVFLVDRAARRNLLPPREAGIDWGRDEWHRVRLVREVDSGRIAVYFDDLLKPVLEVRDQTIEWGRIGFGTFDDSGQMRRLRVRAYEGRSIDPTGSPFEAIAAE